MGAVAPPGSVQRARQGVHRARHAASLPRYLAIGVLVLFVALGVRSAFFSSSGTVAAPLRRAEADAPSQDFALQFARAYLGYDSRWPERLARALAPFLPSALEGAAGTYAAAGRQRVLWAQVASDQPALAGGRVVTVAAGVSTQRLPIYLAVTVRHDRGRPLALIGYPALVGAPAIASSAPAVRRDAVADSALSEVLDRVLRNYLAGASADLEADLSPGAEVVLPTLRLRLQSVEETVWLGGRGSGAVLATVNATDSRGADYTLSYELGVVYRERPYVDFIEVIPTGG
jgi:hypothetical protein